LQQALTDLFSEILKRRLAVSVVQRSMTALAVAPVEADDDATRSAEPRDLAPVIAYSFERTMQTRPGNRLSI
jgi:hypothetical protein